MFSRAIHQAGVHIILFKRISDHVAGFIQSKLNSLEKRNEKRLEQSVETAPVLPPVTALPAGEGKEEPHE